MENKITPETNNPSTHGLESENKMEIEQNPQSTENKNLKGNKPKLHFIDEFSKIYEKSSIVNYLRNVKSQSVKSFINQIVILSESNCINEINSKLAYVDYFSRRNYFSKSEIEILFVCLDKLILVNKNSFYKLMPIFKAMSKLITNKKAKKLKFKLNWKLYYELFIVFFTKSSFEFQFRNYFFNKDLHYITIFFLKLHKFFSFEKEDLLFLKGEVKNYLFSGNDEKYNIGIGIMTVFLKKNKEFFEEEIQNILLTLMKNSDHFNNIDLFGIFSTLVSDGKLVLDKEQILNFVFEKIHEYLTDKTIFNAQSLFLKSEFTKVKQIDGKGREKMQKRLENIVQINLLSIVCHYLVEKNSSEHIQALIKNKLSLVLNIVNYNLKENTPNDAIRHNLGFIKIFLIALKKKTFKKLSNEPRKDRKNEEGKESGKEQNVQEKLDLFENLEFGDENEEEEGENEEENFEKNREYKIIPEYIPQLENILIEYIEPFITKSLFYQSNSSNELLYEIADISENLPNCFMSDNIYKIFTLLLSDKNNENSLTSGNSNWVLVKINCFLKNFFTKINNVVEKSMQSKFNSFVLDSVKNISSANIENSSHIIKFLARIFNLVRINFSEISEKNPRLIKILDDSLYTLYKKIIDLIEMISNKKFNTALNFFFHCSTAYINNLPDRAAFKIHTKNIENLVLSHTKENICDATVISSLHMVIPLLVNSDKEFYQKLFDWIYESLVLDRNEKKKKKGDENNTVIVEKEENYEQCELFPTIKLRKNIELDQLNEKTLKYIILTIDCLDSRFIEFNNGNVEKIYNLIGLLSRSKDKFYLKIMKSLCNFIFNIINKNDIVFENLSDRENVIEKKLENLNLENIFKQDPDKNKVLKSTFPSPDKLNFCMEFIQKTILPLCERFEAKKNEFVNQLNLKSSEETKSNEAVLFKSLNKRTKKKIKKSVSDQIISEKSQFDQSHFKILLGLTKRLNLLKNVFLLIPHKKNEELFNHLVEDFYKDANKNPAENSVKIIEEFINLKADINRRILSSKSYFVFYPNMKTKEILEYYFSFDSYDYHERMSFIKKFSSDHRNLLKKFKAKEKQIFNNKIRLIYIYRHLDLVKNFSFSDIPKQKAKVTILINKIVINCTDNKFKTTYSSNINYLFSRLNHKSKKGNFIDFDEIYQKTKINYEKLIDKIKPEEVVSISVKTKLTNLVFAYSVFLNYFIDSPAIEYSKNKEEGEQNTVENVKKSKNSNNFQIDKMFLDLMNMKKKLYKLNIKELNLIVMNLNLVYYNFFKFFPCDNFIIQKKLFSKGDYLNFLDFQKNGEKSTSDFIGSEKFKNYFQKEKTRKAIIEKIQFYSNKKTENDKEYKNTLLEYFSNFLNELKTGEDEKIRHNIFLNYLTKFEVIYLFYFNMDLQDGRIYEFITELQESLFNSFISDCGFLEKKFCFYLIGFISKLKFKIIIEYKSEKTSETFKRITPYFDDNLSDDEKFLLMKKHHFNKNKQAIDPNCPSDVYYFIEKKINYENLNNISENSKSDSKIRDFLNNEEKLRKFVSSYLLLKDNNKDQILESQLSESTTKKAFGLDLSSTVDKLITPLFYPSKSENDYMISYMKNSNLLSTLESNLIFYNFIVYDFNNWTLLDKVFADLKLKISNVKNPMEIESESGITEEDLDHVHMTVYLSFSAAYLRKMTIEERLGEKDVKELFYFPLKQYGNIRAEKVNREILTFYFFILYNCSIEQLGVILYDNITYEEVNRNKALISQGGKIELFQKALNLENLIILKDTHFSSNKILFMKFMNIFSSENRATKYIFPIDTFVPKLEEFLFNFLDNTVEIIKNLSNYTLNVGTLISLCGFKEKNYLNFIEDFPQEKSEIFAKFLVKIHEKSTSLDSKKIKILLNNILVNYRNFFLKNVDLLMLYLSQIIHFDSIDADNYEIVVRNLRDLMITKNSSLDVFKILQNLQNLLKGESEYMNIDSNSSNNLMNLNLTKKTLILDIYSNFLKYYIMDFSTNKALNFKNNEESMINMNKSGIIFEAIFSIMNNSQYEIRDYISGNLLVNLLMTMQSDEKAKILDYLIAKLRSSNNNLYSANSNLNKEISAQKISENLSSIFALGSFLRFFDMSKAHLNEIDKIISALKVFNSKILKNKGVESKLIKIIMTEFFNRYKNTFEYIKLSLSNDSIEAITDLSKSHSYFM